MIQLVNKPELSIELVNKGNLQKQNFSWEKSSDLLWQSILKTINSN